MALCGAWGLHGPTTTGSATPTGCPEEPAPKQEVPGQVVKSLKDHGFAWLKMSHEEEQRLRNLKHASEQGNHLDLAGNRIKSKTLLRHTEGKRTRRVPYSLHEAADKVAGPGLEEDSLVDVAIPDGYLLVLVRYTLEYATCGIFRAARHKVTLREYTPTERLSVAFKLRCPGSAVLDFHPDLSVNNGPLAARYQQDIAVHELMGLFENEHPSINVRQKSPWVRGELRGQDLVSIGLSPAWQYAINEWRASFSRAKPSHEWVWEKLLSTMSWERPIHQITVKMLTGRIVSMEVHPGWKVAAVLSLLELQQDFATPTRGKLVFSGHLLNVHETLDAAGVPMGATLDHVLILRGD
ncbi:hypothetical protein ABBQ38_014931 [Trebouxia sp. C0009 RCD-2024]